MACSFVAHLGWLAVLEVGASYLAFSVDADVVPEAVAVGFAVFGFFLFGCFGLFGLFALSSWLEGEGLVCCCAGAGGCIERC